MQTLTTAELPKTADEEALDDDNKRAALQALYGPEFEEATTATIQATVISLVCADAGEEPVEAIPIGPLSEEVRQWLLSKLCGMIVARQDLEADQLGLLDPFEEY